MAKKEKDKQTIIVHKLKTQHRNQKTKQLEPHQKLGVITNGISKLILTVILFIDLVDNETIHLTLLYLKIKQLLKVINCVLT